MDVFRMIHAYMGHQDREKTLNLVCDTSFWSGMARDVEEYVRSCDRSVGRKSTDSRVPLVPIHSNQLFLSLDTSFLWAHAIAVPTRNQTAKTTSNALFQNVIAHYMFPLYVSLTVTYRPEQKIWEPNHREIMWVNWNEQVTCEVVSVQTAHY